MKFPELPPFIKYLFQGSGVFLLISVITSLSFTSVAVPLTFVGALSAGFYSAFRLQKKEFLVSILVTLLPNLLLQGLFFWDKAQLVSTSTIVILGLLNLLLVSLAAFAGGIIAYFIHKYKDKKEQEKMERLKRAKDTYWIDRLFATIVLFFYIGMVTLPVIPVQASSDCSSKKQNTNTFIECYDPDNTYQPQAEWVYEPPKNRMPKEGISLEQYYEKYPDLDQEVINQLYTACSQKSNCNFEDTLQTYYDGIQTIKDTTPSIIEGPILIAKGMTYGIFHWNEKNSMKKAYMNGVWLQTQEYSQLIGNFLSHPVKSTVGFVKTNLDLYGSIQRIKFNLAKDSLRYIGNSYKKIFQGNVKQGISDLFNLPKWASFLVDQNYPGGTKKLVKQISSKETWSNIGEGAARMFLTDQTIKLFKQGDWKHGLSQGAGEATVHILAGEAIAKTISLVPKAANFVKEVALLKQVEKEPVAMNPPVNLTPKGLKHVEDRHIRTDIRRWSGKSKFDPGVNVEKVIKDGTHQPMVKQRNGNFVRTYDTGKPVGFDVKTKQKTSIITIVTDSNNNLVTAFPGKP